MPLGLPVVQGRVPVELASAEMHEIETIKTERLCSEEHTSILHLLFLVCILCIACKFSAWTKDTDNLEWQNYWKKHALTYIFGKLKKHTCTYSCGEHYGGKAPTTFIPIHTDYDYK